MTQPTVLITGASRGIGAACAVLFAKKGYRVAVNYLANDRAAEQLLSTLENPESHLLFKADVSDEADCEKLFAAIDNEFGRLDVLVNNVGILYQQTNLLGLNAERIEKVFRSNVISQFLCAKHAVQRMSKQSGGDGGSIVNVSSGAALTGSPNEYLDYAASKGAIDSFTKGLTKEVAEMGIRVNGVRPGLIYTDMHADGGEPGRVERLRQNIPLKRGGYPEEVAKSIYFLASNDASFTTGSFIDVSGGLT